MIRNLVVVSCLTLLHGLIYGNSEVVSNQDRSQCFCTAADNQSIWTTHDTKAQYHSQSRQDRYVNEHFFKNIRNGFFVDVGAHDGVTYSNTLFFEQDLQWKGICIEPIPAIFKRLQQNRQCICFQGCISDSNGRSDFLCITSDTASEYTEMLSGLCDTYDSRHIMRINAEIEKFGGRKEIINVQCYRLDRIFAYYDVHHVDYLSIDVEGAEMQVLQSIDFSKVDIDVITVENNYNTDHIKTFLIEKGYGYIVTLDGDEVYRKDCPSN